MPGTPGADPRRCIDDVREAIEGILAAKLPAPIPEMDCQPDVLPVIRAVNRLIGFAGEVETLIAPLGLGFPDGSPPPDNALVTPFIDLRERLGRLTSEVRRISGGAQSEGPGLLGDLSAAVNTVASLVEQRDQALRAEMTRRKAIEDQLQQERDVLVAGPLVTFCWEPDDRGTVRYVSPNVSAFGYRTGDFLSGRLRYDDIIHDDDHQWVVEDSAGKTQSGLEGWVQEYRIVDADGETRWVRDHTHAVRDELGVVTGYEGYVIDVTAQKRTEAELRRREGQLRTLSLTDDLTGLYNRRGLLALGEHVLRVAQRHGVGLTVFRADVRGLHEINDRFGRDRGDQVLRDVASALRSGLHEADLVARVGGDEFVALIEGGPGTGPETSALLRRRLSARRGGQRPGRVVVRTGWAHWTAGRPAELRVLMDAAAAHMDDPAQREK